MSAPTRDGEFVLDSDDLDLHLGNGTKYRIASVSGLDLPPMKTTDSPIEGFDGFYSGLDLLDGREVQMELGIDGTPDDSDYDDLISALGQAMAPKASTITVDYRRFGRSRRFWARPRGLALPWDADFGLGAARASLRFQCPDPVIYDLSETTSASITTSGTVTNSGTYPVWPVANVRPSIAGTVRITNSTAGKSLRLSGHTSGTLYVFDFRSRTILTGGVDDAYSILQYPPEWFPLEAGANSITVSGCSIQFFYRNGYATG